MKPSTRIKELFDENLDYYYTPIGEGHTHEQIVLAKLNAITEYLDEQYERQERDKTAHLAL